MMMPALSSSRSVVFLLRAFGLSRLRLHLVAELAPCAVERGDVFAVDALTVEGDVERWLG